VKRSGTPKKKLELQVLPGSEMSVPEFEFLARMVAKAVLRRMQKQSQPKQEGEGKNGDIDESES